MPTPRRAGPSPRGAIVAAVLLLHGLVIAVLLIQRHRPPPRPPTVEEMVVRLVAPRLPVASPPAPLPPPPDSPEPPVLQAPQTPPEVTIAADPAPDAPWPVGDCAVAAHVAHAIAADPAALAAVAAAPEGVRSDAGALAMWNGEWVAGAATPRSPLAPLRAAIARALGGAPGACLDAPITGPRLIPVAEGGRATLIVLGSGVWSWRDLAMVSPR